MCGIAGCFHVRPVAQGALPLARRMTDALQHRGPDSAGYWQNDDGRVAFGHRRLAIVDLSEAGAQPMQSPAGRFVIAFNGEIYNHAQLRRELDAAAGAAAWRGHSDTETLLAAFEQWGVETTLRKSVGMFAMALWDRRDQVLLLARDRFGEKPLYYGWPDGAAGSFVFGSELKALREHPGFRNAVSREALARYMRLMYVPAPLSIHEGVFKLEPGCLLEVRGVPPERAPATPLAAGMSHGTVSIQRWWSFAEVVEAAAAQRFSDESEALDALDARIQDAVRLQSLADVPLGAFLSGGVDSSTIAAVMQEQTPRPVKTFTVGFEDANFDESAHARTVAAHLGTEHHELFVTAAEARNVIPHLPRMYDEPFADSSQIPTHLVCRAARAHVTVALSGDAGDELLGGYNRYTWAPRIWKRLRFVPYPLRQALASRVAAVPPQRWDHLLAHAGIRRPGEKLHKLANALDGAHDIDGLYANLATHWHGAPGLVLGEAARGAQVGWPELPPAAAGDPGARMMYWDTLTYLPDDILCKVDRAAMATSLETRVPLLDHRVVETAWRLPLSMKMRAHQGKWALRQVLYRRVPRELIERPKTGFSIPLRNWLTGPLRDWVESLLAESRLCSDGFLDARAVRRAWHEHLSGRFDHTSRLWTVLMFQCWLDELRGSPPSREPGSQDALNAGVPA